MVRNFLDKIYRDLRQNKFLQNIEQGNTHPKETHVGLSDVDLLQRGIEFEISVGTFENEHDYKECLLESIVSNQNEIKKFLRDGKNNDILTLYPVFKNSEYSNPDDPYDFKTRNKCFHLNDTTNHIEEVTTNAYCLVLRKNDFTTYGFNIVTFYPNSNVKYLKNEDINVTPTNKNLNPILEQTKKYKKATTLEKVSLRAQIDPEIKSQVRYKSQRETYNKVISITNVKSKFKDCLEIGMKDVTIVNKHDLPIQDRNIQRLVLDKNPELVSDLRKINKIKKELVTKQNKERKIRNKSLQIPPTSIKDKELEL